MRGFHTKWRALRHRGQLDRDLEDELRFHLEMQAESGGMRGAALGIPPRSRRLAAKCGVSPGSNRGGGTCATPRARSARSPDSRSRPSPRALGIGADTAMFTIVKGALTWDLGLDRWRSRGSSARCWPAYLAVGLVLMPAGVLGCAIPARRALRGDPLVALRCE